MPAPSTFRVLGHTHERVAHEGDELRLMVPSTPAHQVAAHRHADAHLILVLRGRYATTAPTTATAAPTRSRSPLLVFNPPRTEHQDCFAESQQLADARFLSLTLSASTWLRTAGALELPATPTAMCGPAAHKISRAWLRGLGATSFAPLHIETALILALDPFVHDHALTLSESPSWLRTVRARLREMVMEAAGPVRVSDVSAQFGVHPVYLARAFRKRLGISPARYIRDVTLDKAAALLGGTRRPLAELALDCGFFDQAHFANAFRQAYGVSPSAYRANGGAARRSAH